MSQSESRFRPVIETMRGYAPGEWPTPEAGVLKLNSNENPYGPSPRVMAALSNFSGELLRRYPDPLAKDFCHVVGKTFGIPADWVIAGNGSDDVLTLIIRACAEGVARPLAYPTPTYVLYRTLAAMQPASTIEIPYGDDWQLPVAQLLATDAAVTLVATPNSPSGHVVPMADLRALAQGLSGILVVDEAYVDFVEDEGDQADLASLALVRDYDNVIVLRTLSKGYGLAGLRLGFGCAQPVLLEGLFKVKDSYNVDAIALHLASAAIADQDYKRAIAQKVISARRQLTVDLQGLGFRVWPSQTNFLLVQPPAAADFGRSQYAQVLQQGLKERQIMIRYFNEPGLDDKLRITVGTPEQNVKVVTELKRLLLP
ncbi:MAG: histidinol-phosphate transaminase [Cyanobacteria bacterium J06598_3]